MQLLSLLFMTSSATALHVSLASTTTLGRDPQGSARLNGLSFQQDTLVSHNGYQYAVFYSPTEVYAEQYVTLARRNISDGLDWEMFNFTDYKQTTQDSVNTISLGVSPDGHIHLAYDHHDVPLNYRVSADPVAENPTAHTWGPELFSTTLHALPGAESAKLSSVSYPRFETVGDSFLFEAREGTVGDGDSYIYKYLAETASWQVVNKYISSDEDSGYINGLTTDHDGTIHVSFSWRGDANVSSNHDLLYATSDDLGATWKNSAGDAIGSQLTAASPGLTVYSLPEGSGILNQESQAIDETSGRFYVLNRKYNRQDALLWELYMRDVDGIWDRTPISHGLGPITETGHRGKILVTPNGDILAILPSNQDSKLAIYHATKDSGFGEWSEVWSSEGYDVDPLIDRALWKSEGGNVLSLFVVTAGSYPNRVIQVLDFAVSE